MAWQPMSALWDEADVDLTGIRHQDTAIWRAWQVIMNFEVLRGELENAKRASLREVWICPSGWQAVLVEDATGACWRLDYPNSENHGG
ncbi:hypothetical protein KM031_02290 [Gemmobacter fulvus]|uniref:Uncharacterized protein n=1 Tax=Gemmobacter fulvus TaxID=2840474 RepID=A0A975P6W5_9RHOB|nr:hypothetical protein [Gemmobacter fulvus]MBT9244881.1 hypothetical protein [Gemmobacter fulvus]QWK90764.1 hypothetical protein KM031_02290 [Gemmobacter fulvus]